MAEMLRAYGQSHRTVQFEPCLDIIARNSG
jgi:hypothetical protein